MHAIDCVRNNASGYIMSGNDHGQLENSSNPEINLSQDQLVLTDADRAQLGRYIRAIVEQAAGVPELKAGRHGERAKVELKLGEQEREGLKNYLRRQIDEIPNTSEFAVGRQFLHVKLDKSAEHLLSFVARDRPGDDVIKLLPYEEIALKNIQESYILKREECGDTVTANILEKLPRFNRRRFFREFGNKALVLMGTASVAAAAVETCSGVRYLVNDVVNFNDDKARHEEEKQLEETMVLDIEGNALLNISIAAAGAGVIAVAYPWLDDYFEQKRLQSLAHVCTQCAHKLTQAEPPHDEYVGKFKIRSGSAPGSGHHL